MNVFWDFDVFMLFSLLWLPSAALLSASELQSIIRHGLFINKGYCVCVAYALERWGGSVFQNSSPQKPM